VAAGAWPSGRRISSIAFLDVPVQQSVLSLPHRPAFTGVAMSTESRVPNRLYVADFQNGLKCAQTKICV